MTLMQVVFPEPLGPTSPRISPAFRWNCRPSSARNPPKRLAKPVTCKSGCVSGDIDAPTPQKRNEGVRQKQNDADKERSSYQLEILRRRNSDGVVDAVKNNDAKDRPHDRRRSAEQRENDREYGELAAEHGFGVEHRGVPGKHAAGETRDQRAQQPSDDALAHHVDAGHARADGVLADGLQRET